MDSGYRVWGALGLFLAATSCSGAGTEEEAGTQGPTADPADSMSAKAVYDDGDLDHLLKRAEFGVTATSRAQGRAVGVEAYVDAMLAFPTTGTSDAEAAAAQLLVNSSDPAGLEGKFPSQADVTDWWLHIMLHTEHPFRERLAMFFHDHFAVSYDVLNSQERHMMVEHINKLRSSGIGSFKDLVLLMARDPAMMEWLDGVSNVKTEPNENFAREFFELFTVGADRGYLEEDIQEAARAFTGYRNRLNGTTNLRYIEFDETRKDVGAKVLFTDVILRSNPSTDDDFDLVLNATFDNLDVASWLSEKLLLEFVTDAPGATLIGNFAAVIRTAEFDMKTILRTLFLSEAFYTARKSMVRMPIEYGVGIARSTGLLIEANDLRAELFLQGQVPGDPPSVFGWPQGPEWLSAAGMVERANLARRIIGERTYQRNEGFELSMPSGTPTADEVVAHLASLMGVEPSAAELESLAGYLNTFARSGGVGESDPFDPTDSRHVDERVRGLVYILANHPDALAR